MRIGILTFHWATNYGAILQAFALQSYLEELGHDVDIINYKPRQYDYTLINIIKHPSLLRHIWRFYLNSKKDIVLEHFRAQYLNRTERIFTINELAETFSNYDVFISGSDQVLNPSSTMTGDNGLPSPAYWLSFGPKGKKRIGYAVSFGCEIYPRYALEAACKWVNCFDCIGTREISGLEILDCLHYNGSKCLTPDPTILLGIKLFQKLSITVPRDKKEYICVYMLRQEIFIKGTVRYIDEKHKPLCVEEWLTTIVNARGLITNSYHGMIMAILSHVPFSVLLETGEGQGMNDRFRTLLKQLRLENRAVTDKSMALDLLSKPIDFESLDLLIRDFKVMGEEFIQNSLNQYEPYE